MYTFLRKYQIIKLDMNNEMFKKMQSTNIFVKAKQCFFF